LNLTIVDTMLRFKEPECGNGRVLMRWGSTCPRMVENWAMKAVKEGEVELGVKGQQRLRMGCGKFLQGFVRGEWVFISWRQGR
jgi:hypothetical protein